MDYDSLEYSTITRPAETANISEMTEFAEQFMEERDVPLKVCMSFDIAIDELLSNVAKFAYEGDTGDMTLEAAVVPDEGCAVLRFRDDGVPFDPCSLPSPDTTLSAEDRPIGGLGIFMVRKSMDEMKYEYSDGQNVVTIMKRF